MQLNRQLVVALVAFGVAIYVCWSVLTSGEAWSQEEGAGEFWAQPPPAAMPEGLELDAVWDPFPLPEEEGSVSGETKRVRTGRDLIPVEPVAEVEEDPVDKPPLVLRYPPTKKPAPPLPLPDVEMPGLHLVGLSRVGTEHWAIVFDELEEQDYFVRRGERVRDALVAVIDDLSITLRAPDGQTVIELPSVESVDVPPPPVAAAAAAPEPGIDLSQIAQVLPGPLAMVPGMSNILPGLLGAAAQSDAEREATGGDFDLPGVQADDRILAVNGAQASNLERARTLIDAAPAGTTLLLTVLRKGQTVVLKIPR